MLAAIKVWFTALSLAGKIGVITSASVVGLGTLGSMNSTTPQLTPPAVDQPAVKSETDEPKPSSKVEVKTETKTEPIPFQTTTVNDANLAQGKSVVKTEGVNGVKTFTYEVTYTDGAETSRKLVNEAVTTASVTKIIANGTYVAPVAPKPVNNCDPNYTPCVPNVSYDLDCPDIGFQVRVIGSDPHGFDRDNDGYGCESYR